MNSQQRKNYVQAKDVQLIMKDLMESAQVGDLEKFANVVHRYRKDSASQSLQVTDEEIITDFRDGRGRTCMHFAAAAGHLPIAENIIKLCPNAVNLRDENGDTPLHLAVSHGRTELTNFLLECCATVDPANLEMVSPLHYACGSGFVDIAKVLLDKGADITRCSKGAGTPLHWAAGEGRHQVVSELLARGAPPNAVNSQGLPPLLLAAASGSKGGESVALLARAGADTGLVLAGGLTVLHIIADTGDYSAMQALLETPNGLLCAVKCDDQGLKPVEVAAENGHERLVELLLPYSEMPPETSIQNLIENGRLRAAKQEKATPIENEKGNLSDVEINIQPAKSEEDRIEAQNFKEHGNELYRKKEFETAIEMYTKAIEKDSSDAAFWSNRSACYLEIGQPQRALADGETARLLRPQWSKAFFRIAVAHIALESYEEAAMAAWEGLKIDEENHELKKLLQTCVKKGREVHFKQNA